MWSPAEIWAGVTTVSTAVVTAGGGLLLWREKARALKRSDVNDALAVKDAAMAAKDEALLAKDTLVAAHQKNAADFKEMMRMKEVELATYRHEVHEKNDVANKRLLDLVAENERLKTSTDLTPILKHQQEQTQINMKMLQGLELVIEKLSTLKPVRSECIAKPRKVKTSRAK